MRTEFQIYVDGWHVASLATRPPSNRAHPDEFCQVMKLFRDVKHMRGCGSGDETMRGFPSEQVFCRTRKVM